MPYHSIPRVKSCTVVYTYLYYTPTCIIHTSARNSCLFLLAAMHELTVQRVPRNKHFDMKGLYVYRAHVLSHVYYVVGVFVGHPDPKAGPGPIVEKPKVYPPYWY